MSESRSIAGCFGQRSFFERLIVGLRIGREYRMGRKNELAKRIERLAAEAADSNPSAMPIHLATVYSCQSTSDADHRLAQAGQGYVYQRDGHPNSDHLAALVRELHGAHECQVTASGMSALSTVLLALLQQGDHVVISELLYGKSLTLVEREASRWGIASTRVDTTDLERVERAFSAETKMVIVETISNPRLRVADLQKLAELAHAKGACLVVDNTFATPAVCCPLQWGADVVIESMTKLMNGHGDVSMGAVATNEKCADRIRQVTTTWGLGAARFESWLVERGLKTMALRVAQANRSAQRIAERLAEHDAVKHVDYPGLPEHPDHELARQLMRAGEDGDTYFGNMVTFTLRGDEEQVDRWIQACPEIPFFPSLGDSATSLSHPASTSHRGMTADERAQLGIEPSTIRLSVGIEPTTELLASIEKALRALDD